MSYNLVIVLTFIGFMALAAALLIPVYRFLKREEHISNTWTPEALQRQAEERRREQAEPTAKERP